MLTDKQLEANRCNATNDEPDKPYPHDAQSQGHTSGQGPNTETGKNVSKLNALRHNLTGQVTTMTEHDRAAYNKLSVSLLKDLAPIGGMEVQIAERIVSDSWRLNRAAAIEDNLYARGHQIFGGQSCPENEQIDAALTAARVYAAEAKNLQLLSLYEQRLNRTLQKNLALLKSLQTERKAQEKTAMEEAQRLLQLNEMRNIPYDPASDGFVFSINQIHTAIDRTRRLERASHADFSRFKPRRQPVQAARLVAQLVA